MRVLLIPAVLGLLLLLSGPSWAGEELSPPTAVVAGGEPIDVVVGHAAPFMHDMDGDGLLDLLVGQMGGGKLRIYRNVGTASEPRFDDFETFKIGETDATVPSG